MRSKDNSGSGNGPGDDTQIPLPLQLRRFAENHNWHEPGIYTNKRILRRVFAKPIAKAVAELAINGKIALSAQIQTDFAHLQKIIRSLDRMCIKRIDEDDEEVVFEHIKGQLKKILMDLAAMLEGGQKSAVKRQKPARKIVDTPPAEPKPLRADGHLALAGEEQWVTVTEAGKLLGKNRGTISHWAKNGKITDNGKKGHLRRVLKTDILLIKQTTEEEDSRRDLQDLQDDSRRIK